MRRTRKAETYEGWIVDAQLLDTARDYVFQPKAVRSFPCRICSEPGATEDSDGLCWVCRHLKISAWRESETQEAASE